MASNDSKHDYTAQSIRVIEGLEAVRKRPAMYIGSTGPQGLHHLVYEVVDNSVDEALAGHCDTITVILHTDGSCSVEDNGRGIPTDIHKGEGVSAAEVVLTKLHAGGKFDKDTYKFSGGLHGVGISVVNALSSKLLLEIYQHGKIHVQHYERGKPLDRLTVVETTTKRGTLVRFTPDPVIFTETVEFNFDVLSSRLRELAFLNKGLHISITDERTSKKHDFYFEGGIVSFIEHINAKKTPLFPDIIHGERSDNDSILEFALQYNDGYGEQIFSFVNNINTVEGGTHVTGFKAALTKASNKRAQNLGLLKEGESFSSEDVREGLVCVINMKVAEPQFEGQTKTKLGNSDIKGMVESSTFSVLDTYFEEHPSIARKILQKAELALQAREAAKRARELTRKKGAIEAAVLPGKLAGCSTEDPSKAELFIVEGDSAGGSAKQGRERQTQAILPLRGKILNVEKARFDKILSNEEIRALIAAIGSGIREDFAIEKARYHKIILMTDADVDGAHIRTLLLTFFFRYMRPLIDYGYLYIAQPPLYKIKIGKKEQYIKDNTLFKAFLTDWARENTSLVLCNKELNNQEWQHILDELILYEAQLEKTAHNFLIATPACHLLMSFLAQAAPIDISNNEEFRFILEQFFPQYKVSLKQEIPAEQGPDVPATTYIVFRDRAREWREWRVNSDFFIAPEVQSLLKITKSLGIISQGWILTIPGKERSIEGKTIAQLLTALDEISKPYMHIQRYKGLGEMNPEQLWETSMDPKTRNVKQVTLGDALEADWWFDTLMGDDVAGRRVFIEEHGHFVKNLDV
jgi:DNA gyrase subunit B